jgi:2-keto-3-deoxy-L-rhamnonate aldolase RhmA
MQAAEDAVLSACARHGKRAGMLMKAGMSIDHYRRKGFSIIALGSDVGCLKQGYEKLLK